MTFVVHIGAYSFYWNNWDLRHSTKILKPVPTPTAGLLFKFS